MSEMETSTLYSEVHSYPRDLADFARGAWPDPRSAPEISTLRRVFSVCFQASLMREEERPIIFRMILGGPELFPPNEGPPSGLHKLEFEKTRPFDENEIRRLSPAADFYRSVIGVKEDADGVLCIWGIVYSGPRWIETTQGGRSEAPPLPPALAVHAANQGVLEVYRGPEFLAKLDGGRLLGAQMDVFASKWMLDGFKEVVDEIAALHIVARSRATEPWAPLDPELTHSIGQHALRRMISVLRDSRHGATLVFVPLESVREFSKENGYVSFKYRFADARPRHRFRNLLVEIMNRLAEVHGRGDAPAYTRDVGWEEYRESEDPEIAGLDEAVFEVSHLVASLAAADGAVVMSKRYELLGFGAEISGSLPDVKTVQRALDLEGERTAEEDTENVGTRHRSAYRLAGALPEAVVVVVSQDGSVRFVTQKDGAVTYWEQA
ncbi:MAG: DNA integrity scanning protein DisA nucleotide-binding domain protein [Rubrobacter sp.]|nr:DNA integrity scanning protein DisA nucleotide-binding domain protein [Rubrobacter sp.]